MTPETQGICLLRFSTDRTEGRITVTKYAIAWSSLFALHQDIGLTDLQKHPGWTISHRPTGMSLVRALSLATAVAAFDDLLATATMADWDSRDVNVIQRRCGAFGRAFRLKWNGGE